MIAIQLWVTDKGVYGRPVVSLAPWLEDKQIDKQPNKSPTTIQLVNDGPPDCFIDADDFVTCVGSSPL